MKFRIHVIFWQEKKKKNIHTGFKIKNLYYIVNSLILQSLLMVYDRYLGTRSNFHRVCVLSLCYPRQFEQTTPNPGEHSLLRSVAGRLDRTRVPGLLATTQ